MTFNVNIDKIFEHLRKLGPLAFALSCTTGFILFVPESIRESLHISNLPEIWYKIIGISFIISIFLIIFSAFQTVLFWFKKKILVRMVIKKRKKAFLTFNTAQKNIVREILQCDMEYIIMNHADGNANYLVKLGFIYRPSQPAILFENDEIGVKYLPQPWLITEYNRNPDFFLRDT